MSFSLIRNARLFFTTNVDANTGAILASGFLPANTQEIQVLDGLSFSQNTTAEVVTLEEGGNVPVRGQQSFNTALEPVDLSFSTYARPADGGVNITAEEGVLWNAMFTNAAIGTGTAAWVEAPSNASVTLANSQKHQLQQFGIIVVLEGSSYAIDNCALDTATIDFGLDQIAMIQWGAKATQLRQLVALTATSGGTVTFGGPLSGTALGKNVLAPFIANKLSTLEITGGINGTGTVYNVPITGGSLSISNNITYLTPANLGVVNVPITYFAGTRSITGTLNAYLRTGALNTAGLLSDMLAGSSTDVSPAFYIQVEVGGASNATRIEFEMPAAVLTIPTIATEQVISTAINFTAQSSSGAAFDIGGSNEITIRYITPNI